MCQFSLLEGFPGDAYLARLLAERLSRDATSQKNRHALKESFDQRFGTSYDKKDYSLSTYNVKNSKKSIGQKRRREKCSIYKQKQGMLWFVLRDIKR